MPLTLDDGPRPAPTPPPQVAISAADSESLLEALRLRYGLDQLRRPDGQYPSLQSIPLDLSLEHATGWHTYVCQWLEFAKTSNALDHAREVLLAQELNKLVALARATSGKDVDKWGLEVVEEHQAVADKLAVAKAAAILSDGLLQGLEKTRLALSRVITSKSGGQGWG